MSPVVCMCMTEALCTGTCKNKLGTMLANPLQDVGSVISSRHANHNTCTLLSTCMCTYMYMYIYSNSVHVTRTQSLCSCSLHDCEVEAGAREVLLTQLLQDYTNCITCMSLSCEQNSFPHYESLGLYMVWYGKETRQ